MQIETVLISHMSGFKDQLSRIKKVLKHNGIRCRAVHRKKLKTKYFSVDMAISLGGDGTFLRTSHFVFNEVPILGINPDPKNKEGFFTSATIKDFADKIDRIQKGSFKVVPLMRLKVKLNGRRMEDLALNEFYFGRALGYHMSKYKLSINGRSEIQKSSGVLVGTPQGTHSWIGSVGGKKLPLKTEKFEFIVREPYHGKLIKARVLKGLLKPKQRIRLVPLTKNFILVVDSLKEIALQPNDRVDISMSTNYLNYIC